MSIKRAIIKQSVIAFTINIMTVLIVVSVMPFRFVYALNFKLEIILNNNKKKHNSEQNDNKHTLCKLITMSRRQRILLCSEFDMPMFAEYLLQQCN